MYDLKWTHSEKVDARRAFDSRKERGSRTFPPPRRLLAEFMKPDTSFVLKSGYFLLLTTLTVGRPSARNAHLRDCDTSLLLVSAKRSLQPRVRP
jgi:hypothetical protein